MIIIIQLIIALILTE